MPKPETEADIQVARELRDYLFARLRTLGPDRCYMDGDGKYVVTDEDLRLNCFEPMENMFRYIDSIRGARTSEQIKPVINDILGYLVQMEKRILQYEKKELTF